MTNNVRLIAFYLPQFHPIPENDEWWGKGFTEWTNVVKAKPLFSGHYQPHLPADLGFYDLRVPEVRQAQADLAREYGIYGFCYYHYWFNGKRLLNTPLDEVLRLGKPDLPFCLCWANENWTRGWDGQDNHVLIKQQYSDEDDKKHIHWLVNVFQDKRYIKVGNKPLFLVYKCSKLPDPVKTTTIWREEAKRSDIGEIFLCRIEGSPQDRQDPNKLGFDAAVEFQPDWLRLGPPLRQGKFLNIAIKAGLLSPVYQDKGIRDYASIVERMLKKKSPTYKWFRCVTPMWDNSPRRKRGACIFKGSTSQLYQKWLKAIIEETKANDSLNEKIVFINAWNEWAEGNHLEPDLKFGRGYLEATKQALNDV